MIKILWQSELKSILSFHEPTIHAYRSENCVVLDFESLCGRSHLSAGIPITDAINPFADKVCRECGVKSRRLIIKSMREYEE